MIEIKHKRAFSYFDPHACLKIIIIIIIKTIIGGRGGNNNPLNYSYGCATNNEL